MNNKEDISDNNELLNMNKPLINSNDNNNNNIILYKYRFLVIFLYFYHLLLTGGIQNTWAPIQDRVILVFNTNTTHVNWLALLYPFVNILLSFFTGFTLERKGLHFTLGWTTIITLIGAWIRYIGTSNTHIYIVMLGQGIVALGQPFALAASTQLSEAWFSEDGRAISTAVGGLAPIIGTVLASVVGPMFFQGVSCSDISHNHRKLTDFVFITAILVSIDCLLMIICFRNHPPTPPSISSAELTGIHNRHEDDLPLSTMIKKALTNYNFLLMMGGFGFGYASVNMLTTLINQILHPLNYTDTQIGNIGAGLGFGIIGSIFVGIWLDLTKKFTLIVRTCAVLASGGMIWFLLILWSNPSSNPHPTLAFISLSLLGFFAIPMVPVILEIGVEVTYPLSEGVSTSLLWMSGNLFGMIAVLVGDAMQGDCISESGPPNPNSCNRDCIRKPTSMRNATYLMGSFFGFAVLTTIFFNGRFLRMEAEAAYKEKKQQEEDEEENTIKNYTML